MTKEQRPYHHGDLRNALIAEALEVIAEEGPAALSLRDLARRLGVSHGAPAHHFPDKTALLTAIAAEGYELLAEQLEKADDFKAAGLAYVRFSLEHPAHVAVMYQPSLYDPDDAAVSAARGRAAGVLYDTAGLMPGRGEDARMTGLAGWCLMHGFASLWLAGNLRDAGSDPLAIAEQLAETTFGR